MPSGWRIAQTKYSGDPFDGEGARLYGGRWNSPGIRMVYLAESVALATLEILVHVQDASILRSYSLCEAQFDESLIQRLDLSVLPPKWREYPAPHELQLIGDSWVASGSSVILQVPSAVLDGRGVNYLLNPLHPDIRHLVTAAPEPYGFDPRLFARHET